MAGKYGGRSPWQQELLRLLRPYNRRMAQVPSERVRPELAAVGRAYAGRPAAEVVVALEQVVRAAGAKPDMGALAEFAEEISAGGNPFE